MAAYTSGLSVRQLAVRYGVNITTARNHLKAADVELRPFRKLSPQQVAEVCQQRVDGASLVELASTCGVSTSTIRRVLVPHQATFALPSTDSSETR